MESVEPDPEHARLVRWYEERRRVAEIASLGRWLGPLAPLARGFRRRVLRPLRFAAVALRQVARSGGTIARRDGVGRAAQAWQAWRLAVRHGLRPGDFYLYRLYDAAHRARAARYVPQNVAIDVVANLGPPAGPLASKLEFRRACRDLGLPTVPILAHFRAGELALEDGPEPDSPAWDRDLYVKPTRGGRGIGVRLWRARGEGLHADADGGRALSRAELFDHYRRLSTGGVDSIVQPRIRNHPDLEPVANGCISSLRLTTYRNATGEVEVAEPVLKLPVGASVADNLHRGNLAAPVDPETGRLGVARTHAPPGHVVDVFETHPDTGTRIAGRTVPFFPEALDLCRRAHASFEGSAAIGWDCALTADGPVLIEGNHTFGVEILQLAWDRPLGDTGLPAALWRAVKQVHPSGPGLRSIALSARAAGPEP